MIILKYSGTEYPSCPDGLTKEIAMEYIDSYRSIGKITIPTSSSILVHQFCNLVCHDVISPDDIEIIYEGQVIKVDEHGRMSPWPKGFMEYNTNLLSSTMRKGIEKRKIAREKLKSI